MLGLGVCLGVGGFLELGVEGWVGLSLGLGLGRTMGVYDWGCGRLSCVGSWMFRAGVDWVSRIGMGRRVFRFEVGWVFKVG